MTHHVETDRSVADHTRNINRWTKFFDRVEIFTVSFPIPWQAIQYGFTRNVFHVFHHFSKKFPICFFARGESYPAIAHERSSNAMPRNRRQHRIPSNLGI